MTIWIDNPKLVEDLVNVGTNGWLNMHNRIYGKDILFIKDLFKINETFLDANYIRLINGEFEKLDINNKTIKVYPRNSVYNIFENLCKNSNKPTKIFLYGDPENYLDQRYLDTGTTIRFRGTHKKVYDNLFVEINPDENYVGRKYRSDGHECSYIEVNGEFIDLNSEKNIKIPDDPYCNPKTFFIKPRIKLSMVLNADSPVSFYTIFKKYKELFIKDDFNKTIKTQIITRLFKNTFYSNEKSVILFSDSREILPVSIIEERKQFSLDLIENNLIEKIFSNTYNDFLEEDVVSAYNMFLEEYINIIDENNKKIYNDLSKTDNNESILSQYNTLREQISTLEINKDYFKNLWTSVNPKNDNANEYVERVGRLKAQLEVIKEGINKKREAIIKYSDIPNDDVILVKAAKNMLSNHLKCGTLQDISALRFLKVLFTDSCLDYNGTTYNLERNQAEEAVKFFGSDCRSYRDYLIEKRKELIKSKFFKEA